MSKIKVMILLLLGSVFLIGCTKIQFVEPQPRNKRVLNYFPRDFRGAFISEGEDTIFVSKNYYSIPETIEKKISIKQVESLQHIRVIDSLIYNDSLSMSKGMKFTIENDTLFYDYKTYVNNYLSESLVVKKQSNRLIINMRDNNSGYWNVYLFEKQDKKDLYKLFGVGNFKAEHYSKKIKYDGELKDFFSITNFKKTGDNDYVLSPSAREFKKLIKKGFFVSYDKNYIRVEKE